MKTSLALLSGVTALVAAGGLAVAAERTIGIDAQKSLGLTVYNGGTAMVRDVRSISLDKGENRLAFKDVSGQIQPETASLRPLGGAKFSLVEQDFSHDLLTPQKLTEAAVGSTIQVVRVNPATGAETTEEATVLSANSGVVLQYKDRIEVLGSNGFDGRLVFTKIPENLQARPTLTATVNAPRSSSGEAELAYLTGGLTWSADYVASLNPDETRMDLQAWITLVNSSGTTFRDAMIQVVAGQVNRVDQRSFQPAPLAFASAKRSEAAVPESMGTYQLYTLPMPATIADQQTKQIALFNADGVKVTRRLEASSSRFDYGRSDPNEEDIAVQNHLAFDNAKAAGLGMPMPQGVVRVYKSDSRNRSQFVGEDRIADTPKNETADLVLGNAFDVTVHRKQTAFRSFRRQSGSAGETVVYESTYEVTARNAGSRSQSLTYTDDFNNNWTITAENSPHAKRSAGRAAWALKLPPQGEFKLTYTVQVEVPQAVR